MASEQRAGLEIERHDDAVTVVQLARSERHNAIDAATAVVLTALLQRRQHRSCRAGDRRHRRRGHVLHRRRRRQRSRMRRSRARSTIATPPRTSAVWPRRCGRSRSRWSARSTARSPGSDGRSRSSVTWSSPTGRRAGRTCSPDAGWCPTPATPTSSPRIIPFHRLNEIALLSDTLTSAELDAWGLLNRCVPR